MTCKNILASQTYEIFKNVNYDSFHNTSELLASDTKRAVIRVYNKFTF